MGTKFSVPLWLRWFVAFGLLGFVGPMISGAPFEDLVYTVAGWLIFMCLVLFPGERGELPRMFAVAMVVWIVCIPVMILLLVNVDAWNDFASGSPERDQAALGRLMLLAYLVLLPALVVTLWKRLAAFRLLVVVLLLYDVVPSLIYCAPWDGDIPAALRWRVALDMLLEIAVLAYLLLHFRTRSELAGLEVPQVQPQPPQPAQ